MPVRTPTQVPSAQLTRSLKTIEKAVAKATSADGTVDVAKLDQELKSGDAGAQLGLDSVLDAFQREVRYTTGGGCGSSSRHHTRMDDPTTLKADEVSTVLSALVEARSKAAGFDTHKASGRRGKDGELSPEEAARAMASAGGGLAGELAADALRGAESDLHGDLKLAQKLQHGLDRTAAAVRVVAGRDGSVDMAALATSFARLPAGIDGDGVLQAINNAYQRAHTVRSSGGCGGGSTSVRYDDPKKLSESEADAVHDGLQQAVQLVEDAADSLGRLPRTKLGDIIEDAYALSGLTGEMVELIVDPYLPPPPPRPSYSSGGC